MAWQDTMTTLLRTMVWDLTTPQNYTDDSLQQVIVGAAQLVRTEVSFNTNFVPDLLNIDIVPDPTDPATNDDNFINLVCMKAAAIVDQGVARTQSGIIIRDNGSMVDLSAKLQAAMKMIQIGWAKTYQDQKFIYQSGLLNGPVGAAILGPFRDIARGFMSFETDANYGPREGAGWF